MSQTLHGHTFTKKLLVVHAYSDLTRRPQFLSGGHTLPSSGMQWTGGLPRPLQNWGPQAQARRWKDPSVPHGRVPLCSLLSGCPGISPGRLWPPYSVRLMEFCPGARTPGVGALPYSSIRRDPAMTSGHFALFWAPDPHSQWGGGPWTQNLLSLQGCRAPVCLDGSWRSSTQHRPPPAPSTPDLPA